MLFLARWISQGSRWFSSLLVRIFGATPWLLNRAVAKDKESGQDAGTVVSFLYRPPFGIISLILRCI
jgi:hypothetical protein